MGTLQVTSTEFRNRQAAFLNMADRGERIVIRRGRKVYAVTPIAEEDSYFTPAMLQRIDHSLEQAAEGHVHTFSSAAELDKFIDSL